MRKDGEAASQGGVSRVQQRTRAGMGVMCNVLCGLRCCISCDVWDGHMDTVSMLCRLALDV